MPGTYRHFYLDFNASTPVAPEVVDAMRMVLEEPYGNPSSGHWAGSPAREAVDKARMQVAGLLGCKTNEIVFTSGEVKLIITLSKGCSSRVEERMLTSLPPKWNIRQ